MEQAIATLWTEASDLPVAADNFFALWGGLDRHGDGGDENPGEILGGTSPQYSSKCSVVGRAGVFDRNVDSTRLK